MKKITILIFIIILMSCSFEDYSNQEYNVQVNNPFSGVLVEASYNIILENISSQIIIKINYDINGKEYIIIDDIVPEQKVVLLSRYDENIICTITGVTFY